MIQLRINQVARTAKREGFHHRLIEKIKRKAEFDPAWIIFGNRRIIGLSHYEAEHLRGALDMMTRTRTRYPWNKIISHKFPLEAIEEAFVQQDKGHVTRAAIVPS